MISIFTFAEAFDCFIALSNDINRVPVYTVHIREQLVVRTHIYASVRFSLSDMFTCRNYLLISVHLGHTDYLMKKRSTLVVYAVLAYYVFVYDHVSIISCVKTDL